MLNHNHTSYIIYIYALEVIYILKICVQFYVLSYSCVHVWYFKTSNRFSKFVIDVYHVDFILFLSLFRPITHYLFTR